MGSFRKHVAADALPAEFPFGVILGEHIPGETGEEIIVIIGFPETFHHISGAAVEPVILAVFVRHQAVDDGNHVVALFCGHEKFLLFQAYFRSAGKLGDPDGTEILHALAVGADDDVPGGGAGQIQGHVGEVRAAIANLPVDDHGQVPGAQNPCDLVVAFLPDAAPAREFVQVGKTGLAEDDGFPVQGGSGLIFRGLVPHVDAEAVLA